MTMTSGRETAMPSPRYNPNKTRCTGTNRAGKPCGRWAVPGGSGLCTTHADRTRWLAMSQKGGRSTAARHRKRKLGDPLAGLDPQVPLWHVLELLRVALKADFREVGLPHEVDWSTRLVALLVLTRILPDAFKDIENDPAFADVYTLARGVWDEMRRRPDLRNHIVAVYKTEYPPALEQPAA